MSDAVYVGLITAASTLIAGSVTSLLGFRSNIHQTQEARVAKRVDIRREVYLNFLESATAFQDLIDDVVSLVKQGQDWSSLSEDLEAASSKFKSALARVAIEGPGKVADSAAALSDAYYKELKSADDLEARKKTGIRVDSAGSALNGATNDRRNKHWKFLNSAQAGLGD